MSMFLSGRGPLDTEGARRGRSCALTGDFRLEDAYWGYVIHSDVEAPTTLVAAQSASLVAGWLMVAASLAPWVMPSDLAAADLVGMKLGLSVLSLCFGFVLLRFATRGSIPELHIDTRQGEVRQVVRNRSGAPTLLARAGFDAIGGVHIEPMEIGDGLVRLVMRYRSSERMVPVAVGPIAALEPLRHRLGRDLKGSGTRPQVSPGGPSAGRPF